MDALKCTAYKYYFTRRIGWLSFNHIKTWITLELEQRFASFKEQIVSLCWNPPFYGGKTEGLAKSSVKRRILRKTEGVGTLSQAKSSQVKQSQAKQFFLFFFILKKSKANPSKANPSKAKQGPAKPSKAKQRQTKPIKAKQSQVKQSQAKSSKVKKNQV